MNGLTIKYSEPDEQCHEVRLMVPESSSTNQASDWLTAFYKVTYDKNVVNVYKTVFSS